MRYECDCGAIYSSSAGVLQCGDNNHGRPRPVLDIKRMDIDSLMRLRDEISNEISHRFNNETRKQHIERLFAQRMLQRTARGSAASATAGSARDAGKHKPG